MKQSKFLPLLAGALLPMVACQEKTKEDLPTRPNIVYLLADDMGIGDLGCYGQELIQTPTIDSLANAGLRFLNHYAGSTVSAPSRCCLMTGKHTGHAFVRGNVNDPASEGGQPFDYPIPAEEVTVAEVLKDNGYMTGCVGKWGLGGPTSTGSPNKQGFDYFFGYLSQVTAHRYYPQSLWENETEVQLDHAYYSHDLIVKKGLEFIERNADKPFFLYMPVTLPHADLDVPAEDLEMYDGKFDEKEYKNAAFPAKGYKPLTNPRATYATMVTKLDQTLKMVLETLEKKGISENTIVIFSSDNGVHSVGGHNPAFFNSNGGYRGIKRDLYEGGVHTPLVISWPKVIKEHREVAPTSAFWDFLPTVCDIIGAPVPEGVDGYSILPSITGKGKQKEHDALYWEFYEKGGKKAVLKDNWKLIQQDIKKKPYWELFNLAEDPKESTNVLEQNPDKVKELKKIMEESHTPSSVYKF